MRSTLLKYFWLPILICQVPVFSQPLNINVLTDSLWVTGPWTETRDLVFSNRRPVYSSFISRFGVQFRNGTVNTMPNNVSISNLQGSPIIGVLGVGTRVDFTGNFKSDEGQSQPSVAVLDGGHFFVGASCRMDLILPAYFTRQIWVHGDGTGTFELDSGFVADLTQNGTNPEGCGSLRFSNTRFVSHHTQSLPMGYRPNTITGIADINSHLVFHNTPGSTWVVASKPQTYRGGLWVEQSMTVETQNKLYLPGVNTVTNEPLGGSYTNYGGIHLYRSNVVLTKSGPDSLIINGHQSYALGAKILINEGAIRFDKDPWVTDPSIALYPNVTRTNNLAVEVQNSGLLHFNNINPRIRVLRSNSLNSKIQTVLLNTITVRDTLELNAGTFEIIIPNGLPINQGNEYQVLNLDSVTSKFGYGAVSIPDFGGAITWDTDSLFITGVLKVASGSVLSSLPLENRANGNVAVYPNPAFDFIEVSLPKNTSISEIFFVNAQGKRIKAEIGNQTDSHLKLNISSLKRGIYFLPQFRTSFVKE